MAAVKTFFTRDSLPLPFPPTRKPDVPSLNRASILIADDRASSRYRLLLEAQASETQTDGISVTLHDLSQSGLLFEAEAGIERDAEIMLDIPGVGPVAARLIWTNGNFYGAEFASPLTADDLKAALAESKVVWPHFAPPPDIEQALSQRMSLGAGRAQQEEEDRSAAKVQAVEDDGGEPEPTNWQPAAVDPKLPVPVRLRIIVGLTLALWSALFGLAWIASG